MYFHPVRLKFPTSALVEKVSRETRGVKGVNNEKH